MREGVLASLLLVVGCAGCGASSSPASTPQPTTPASVHVGDIPDTAVYLTYHAGPYSLSYVEGWSIQLLAKTGVLINDKDSSEQVTIISPAHAPQASVASTDLARLSGTLPHFHLMLRQPAPLPAGRAVRAQYRTLSSPDPVTGKQVSVIVDRYYIPGPGKRAVLTLSTPLGVDNVDAFRLIARSFRWK